MARGRTARRLRPRWRLAYLLAAGVTAGLLVARIEATPASATRPAATGSPVRPRLVARTTGRLPVALEGAAVAGALLVGGLVDGTTSTRTVRTLPALGVWGHLAAGMHDTAARFAGNALYVLGGGLDSGPSATIWRVSPHGAVAVGSLPQPLSDQAGVTLGRVTYIFGGYTGHSVTRSILAFTPPDHVRQVARLPVGLRYAAAAALHGRIYLAGGLSSAGLTDEVLRFDPASGRVTSLDALPSPLMYATLWATAGHLVLLGGRTPTGFTDRTWLVNPATGHLTPLAPLNSARGYAMLAPLGAHRALLMGGRSDGRYLDTILTLKLICVPSSRKGARP